MKKITTLMTLALLAVLSLSFTSCDDDDEIAYTLEGTWRGNMYVSSEWNGSVYDATYSEICFLRDSYSYSSGTGYWVDYYNNAGWGRNYIANHIDWRVNYGRIEVYFVEEGATIFIKNYNLNDNYFTGTIYDNGNCVDFSLNHISSPNWYGIDYWGWDTYYYAKENNTWTRANKDAEPVAAPKRIFRTNK
jgi:hypothetical protein